MIQLEKPNASIEIILSNFLDAAIRDQFGEMTVKSENYNHGIKFTIRLYPRTQGHGRPTRRRPKSLKGENASLREEAAKVKAELKQAQENYESDI
jgi:hypothetical protein